MKSTLVIPKYTHDYCGTGVVPSLLFKYSWIYTHKESGRYRAWKDGTKFYIKFKRGFKSINEHNNYWEHRISPIKCYF